MRNNDNEKNKKFSASDFIVGAIVATTVASAGIAIEKSNEMWTQFKGIDEQQIVVDKAAENHKNTEEALVRKDIVIDKIFEEQVTKYGLDSETENLVKRDIEIDGQYAITIGSPEKFDYSTDRAIKFLGVRDAARTNATAKKSKLQINSRNNKDNSVENSK